MVESTNNRKDKAIMRECCSALTYYAVSVVFDDKSASTAATEKVRDLIENVTLYWGLGGESTVKDYLDNFDYEVEESKRGNLIGADVDIYSACADSLTGLAVHGMDLINNHENDAYAMKQALLVGGLMNEIAYHFGITQEMTYASDTDRQFRNSVKGMLGRMDLPGNAVDGVVNANYNVKQAITFENGVGFSFAHNPQAASPYVTWRTFESENSKPEYEWGNYFSDEEDALVDYVSRANKYAVQENAKEKQPLVESQHSSERTYRAEVCDYGEPEFPQIEDFTATDDVAAVKRAYELCDELGVMLLEIHELDENGGNNREINLRYHDPEAQRFMGIDILEFLRQIADKTIIHYPKDFDIDVNSLWKEALSDNPDKGRLMWHCCSYGTHLVDEDEVFIKGTGAYSTWVDYRPKDEDMHGYVIEITGYKSDSIIGNVYDIGDYYSHSQYVREESTIIDTISLTYSPDWGINAGKTVTVPRYEYDKDRHRLMSESGDVVKIKYNPAESVKKMADILQAEKIKHMAMPIGDTQEHLEKLEKKLAELRGLPEPTKSEELRIYHADLNDPDIPERMEIIAAKDDADAWKQANDICAEGKGVIVLELNEADKDGNMREVYSSPPGSEMLEPDPSISEAERDEYGYSYDGMHPLNKDRAMELFTQDCTIYLLWDDDTESMVSDSSEIMNHGGIFGIDTDDWERSNAYKEMVANKILGIPSPQKTAEKQAEAVNDKPQVQEKPEKPIKPKKPNRDAR